MNVIMKQLTNAITAYPHMQVEARPTIEEWNRRGHPCCWQVVGKDEDFTVLVDSSYGFFALFYKGSLVDHTRGDIVRFLDCLAIKSEDDSGKVFMYRQVEGV